MNADRPRALAWIALSLACASLGTFGVARATTLQRMSAEELAVAADLVVHGDVVRVGTRMRAEAGHLAPETVVLVAVREHMMTSTAAPSELELVQRGGRYRGGGHVVHGHAPFRRGDEVVVFARQQDDAMRVVGMSMGAYFAEPLTPSPSSVAARDPSMARFSRRTDGARVLDRLLRVAMPEPRVSLAALRACARGEGR